MNARSKLLGVALAAAAVPAATASAQGTPPVGGSGHVGGTVPSYLELILGEPTSSLAHFKKKRTYRSSFEAMVTASDEPTLLTLADGDTTSRSRRGRLMRGSHKLRVPLQARVGKAHYQGLNASFDPLLTTFDDPVSREAAKVKLRQRLRHRARGTYHKIILVTLSSQTP